MLFILYFDATDDPIHGAQEGKFFHGYYDSYCYLPLFCFCGEVPLWAQLHTSEHDASARTVEALEKIVTASSMQRLLRGDALPIDAQFFFVAAYHK